MRVNVDAKDTNRTGWSRTKRADGRTSSGQAMLATVRCAPHELRLVIVELQVVGLHPVSDCGDAVGDF